MNGQSLVAVVFKFYVSGSVLPVAQNPDLACRSELQQPGVTIERNEYELHQGLP